MYDVITIGGATLDIFLDIHEASKHYRIIKDESGEWVSFKKGEKIPLDTLHYDVGGNAANVAVGLARLGIRTAAHIHYGDDEISQKIITTLKQEGVSTEFAHKDSHETSPISIIINAAGDRTIFAHHIVRDHVLPLLSVPKWIYLTSVGERWEDLYRQVIEFAQTNNVRLAFNPGSNQMESGVDSFLAEDKMAYALFVNKEEGKKIAKIESNDVKTILTQLKSIGPKIVSITDGKDGAYAIDEQGLMFGLGIFPATVLELTGAGDAYASGFLGAVVQGLPLSEAMRFGAVNASSVIGTVGAEKGLLRKDAIEKILSQHPNFQAMTI
jgi:ribokinase